MTSHTISHGRLAVVVGKTLLVGRLLVYFARFRSLFSFTLLTCKIIIMTKSNLIECSQK